MVLYGAGGHAKVVLDCIRSMGKDVNLVFDDSDEKKDLKGIPIVHYNRELRSREDLIIAIGDNMKRKLVAERISHRPGEAIHGSAKISHHAHLGEGTVVMPSVIVNADAVTGIHCILNSACIVEHDCVLEDYVHIAPKAALGGEVKIGEGTLVGIGAIVLPQVSVGKWCIVGAGAVVTRDVPDYSIVAGVPAHIIKNNSRNV